MRLKVESSGAAYPQGWLTDALVELAQPIGDCSSRSRFFSSVSAEYRAMNMAKEKAMNMAKKDKKYQE